MQLITSYRNGLMENPTKESGKMTEDMAKEPM